MNSGMSVIIDIMAIPHYGKGKHQCVYTQILIWRCRAAVGRLATAARANGETGGVSQTTPRSP